MSNQNASSTSSWSSKHLLVGYNCKSKKNGQRHQDDDLMLWYCSVTKSLPSWDTSKIQSFSLSELSSIQTYCECIMWWHDLSDYIVSRWANINTFPLEKNMTQSTDKQEASPIWQSINYLYMYANKHKKNNKFKIYKVVSAAITTPEPKKSFDRTLFHRESCQKTGLVS